MRLSLLTILSLLFATTPSFAQSLELVERMGVEQIKVVKMFGSESFNVEVSHLKVSKLSDVDSGSLTKLSSYEMALLQFNSTKSEATGVSYAAAAFGGRGGVGLSLKTELVRNSGTLSLEANRLIITFDELGPS